MNKSQTRKILHDRITQGLSFRSLAKKYNTSVGTIHRIVKKEHPVKEKPQEADTSMPDDVAQLKELLRKERLRNELLNNIIDIADKELGTNIRKKSGIRRSE
jgi:transposase